MVNVICVKWGTKFGPEYVNRLRSMVRRHLSKPHRFVCLTDDTQGFEPDIETFPLPEMNPFPGNLHGWRKLTTFASPLYDLKGQTLFLDLDVVILQSIDCFFEFPGKFPIIHDWDKPWRQVGNSSVYRFEAGAYPEVLDYFLKNMEQVQREIRNEQQYLSREIIKRGELVYWPKEWCVSFKAHCIPWFPKNVWAAPAPPPGTRIVIFHGNPKPDDAVVGRRGKAFRFMRPAPWVAENWR